MWYRWDGEALLLHLRVQPGARSNGFTGPYGEDRYKVRISAPPVDGKANKHLTVFLATEFGVSKNAVTLLSGDSSRDKLFRIESPSRFPLPEISR